jgi:hypothetical protein
MPLIGPLSNTKGQRTMSEVNTIHSFGANGRESAGDPFRPFPGVMSGPQQNCPAMKRRKTTKRRKK